MQHLLLLRESVVSLPTRTGTVYCFVPWCTVQRAEPDLQILINLNKLMNYCVRIVDIYNWKRESLGEMQSTSEHLSDYLYSTVITNADPKIRKTHPGLNLRSAT